MWEFFDSDFNSINDEIFVVECEIYYICFDVIILLTTIYMVVITYKFAIL